MKKTHYILALLASHCLFAQVGINTSTPHPSSLLDINSNSKGLLIPKYNLQTLKSNQDPIHNPANGLLIYNEGGNYPKGIYHWTGTEWSKFHTQGDFNEIFSLGIDMNTNPNTPLVNAMSTSNKIKSFKVRTNTISGTVNATFNSNNGLITLPKGTYIAHIKLDGVIDNKVGWDNSSYYSGAKNEEKYHNISVNAVFQDELEQNLTEVQYGSQLLQKEGLFGYEYNFLLKLDKPSNNLYFKLFYDPVTNTYVTNSNATAKAMTPQQSGLKVTFTRIK